MLQLSIYQTWPWSGAAFHSKLETSCLGLDWPQACSPSRIFKSSQDRDWIWEFLQGNLLNHIIFTIIFCNIMWTWVLENLRTLFVILKMLPHESLVSRSGCNPSDNHQEYHSFCMHDRREIRIGSAVTWIHEIPLVVILSFLWKLKTSEKLTEKINRFLEWVLNFICNLYQNSCFKKYFNFSLNFP